jgi:hypothetical protein
LFSIFETEFFSGFVETLKRNKQSLLGALFFTLCFRPRRSGVPHIAIIRRLIKKSDKRGGQGMFPLCCLPNWGREGVTLIAAADNKLISEKGFQQSRFSFT